MDAADPTILKYLVKLTGDIEDENEDIISDPVEKDKLSDEELDDNLVTLETENNNVECEDLEGVIFVGDDGDYYYQSAESSTMPVKPIDNAKSYKKVVNHSTKLSKNDKISKSSVTSTSGKKNVNTTINKKNSNTRAGKRKNNEIFLLRENYRQKKVAVIENVMRKETRSMSAQKKAASGKQKQIIIEIDPKEFKEENGKYSNKSIPINYNILLITVFCFIYVSIYQIIC